MLVLRTWLKIEGTKVRTCEDRMYGAGCVDVVSYSDCAIVWNRRCEALNTY